VVGEQPGQAESQEQAVPPAMVGEQLSQGFAESPEGVKVVR